ncbi:hypothetical protein BRD17_03620, partial [Halobacteriales archaeon SW_7_68_16]
GEEVDEVLASLSTGEEVRALIVTDGAQDESVVPVIRSRVTVDGVRRVVVRQAQDLESMYYTIKQVLDDPETRGTILVPLGVLLLVYPLSILARMVDLPGVVFGFGSGLLGLYVLSKGLGIGAELDRAFEGIRRGLYAGRFTLIAYASALALLVVGGVAGVSELGATRTVRGSLSVPETVAALSFGAVQWIAAAGVTTSVGQITDEYLADRLEWRYLNAPFYVVSIAIVAHAVSGYVLGRVGLSILAAALTGGTLLGLSSTLGFAIAESRFPRQPDPGDGETEVETERTSRT